MANVAKIIRLKSEQLWSKAKPRFVSQKGADGRALLERDVRESTGSGSSRRIDSIGNTERTLLLGVDFGGRNTRLLAEFPGVEQFYLNRSISSSVAMLRPDEDQALSPFLYFGEEAENKNSNFKTIRPWRSGEIEDPVMAREFVRHVRTLMGQGESLTIRAVVPVPMTMAAEGREQFREAFRGFFDEIVFLPRPYLTALGLLSLNEDADSGEAYVLDLGSGTTELCRVGGGYPGAEDMAGIGFGGDHVDELIVESMKRDYPALKLRLEQVRRWKEDFGCVSGNRRSVVVKMDIDGSEQSINLGNSLKRACDVWVGHLLEMVKAQLGEDDSSNSPRIFLCGGGAKMGGVESALGLLLKGAGYPGIEIENVPDERSSLAARGALEAAKRIRDEQWENFRFSD